MKRNTCRFVAIVAAIFLVTPATAFAMPDWADRHIANPREGAIVEAGASSIRNIGQARRAARLDAQGIIAGRLGAWVETSVRQAAATIQEDFGLDSFEWTQETIVSRSSSAAEAMVRGARTVQEGRDTATDIYWVVLEVSNDVFRVQAAAAVENVVRDIQADIQSAANSQPAATRPDPLEIQRSFANDALRRMNEELDRQFRTGN